jgi:segregation and condensation protein B
LAKKGLENLKEIVEALIFASDVPITADQLKGLIEEATVAGIKKAIDELNLEYKQTNRSFHIIPVAGGYQMVTRKSYATWVKRLFHKRSKAKLSQAALETLSVVAFKQPISRTEIAAIRGVNCDAVVRTLMERKLVSISGRSEGQGRPLLFTTTKEFLRYFGVNAISDLPKPREIEEILKEDKSLPEDEDAVE